jgi:hypothetical protein
VNAIIIIIIIIIINVVVVVVVVVVLFQGFGFLACSGFRTYFFETYESYLDSW